VSDNLGCLTKSIKSLQIRVVSADIGSQRDGLGGRKLGTHADIIYTESVFFFIKKA
jgi:hypothetical protein